MKITVTQSSDKDNHVVVSFFHDNKSIGVAWMPHDTPKELEKKLNDAVYWLGL